MEPAVQSANQKAEILSLHKKALIHKVYWSVLSMSVSSLKMNTTAIVMQFYSSVVAGRDETSSCLLGLWLAVSMGYALC